MTTETQRGPCIMIHPDGSTTAMEREVTTIHDVRRTIFGPVDFGHMTLGPWRFVGVHVDRTTGRVSTFAQANPNA
jgi:hypothetical protein